MTNRVHWTTSYLASRPRDSNGTESLISTFTETLTPRFSINENLIHANGNTSVNFGGQFLSNILTISATYETYYVPANNAQPFEQELSLDVKFKIKGAPTAPHRDLCRSRPAISATQRTQIPFILTTGSPTQRSNYSLGRFVIHGCIVDTDGAPVEGGSRYGR